jgi:hypothetical protein
MAFVFCGCGTILSTSMAILISVYSIEKMEVTVLIVHNQDKVYSFIKCSENAQTIPLPFKKFIICPMVYPGLEVRSCRSVMLLNPLPTISPQC